MKKVLTGANSALGVITILVEDPFSELIRCFHPIVSLIFPTIFSQFEHLKKKRRHFFLSLPTEKEIPINWLKKFGDSEFEIGKTI